MAIKERDTHMYLTANIGCQTFSVQWELWRLRAKKITSFFYSSWIAPGANLPRHSNKNAG